MIIRKTNEADLAAIGEIYENAKRFMRASGNKNQWNGDKPNAETAREDMERGVGYVAEDNGEVVAVFMFSLDADPTYKEIYDGAWLSDEPYGVIHRIAVAEQGRGIIDYCINECFSIRPNLRIDTHRENTRIFEYAVGYVHVGLDIVFFVICRFCNGRCHGFSYVFLLFFIFQTAGTCPAEFQTQASAIQFRKHFDKFVLKFR